MTATQSCSAKKKVSESRQNLKKTPAKDTILLQSHGLEACILTKKRTLTPKTFSKHLSKTMSYYLLHSEIPRTPISRANLYDCFCNKYCRNCNISLVKNKWLIKATS